MLKMVLCRFQKLKCCKNGIEEVEDRTLGKFHSNSTAKKIVIIPVLQHSKK